MLSNYRLGDLIIQDHTLLHPEILTEHPTTIGSDYVLSHDKSDRIGLATQIVLMHTEKYKHLFPPDIECSTVVHLRLGDAVGGTQFFERRLRPFDPSYYQSIVPEGNVYVIGKCHFGKGPESISNGNYTNYDECIELSNSYMENILHSLKATHFDGGHPDIDLCFAAKAKYFVQGRGFYSRLIVEIRRRLGLISIESPSHDWRF
jgi:hypothetical protein